MLTASSLIAELDASFAAAPADWRHGVLRRIVDLFVNDAERYGDEQIGLRQEARRRHRCARGLTGRAQAVSQRDARGLRRSQRVVLRCLRGIAEFRPEPPKGCTPERCHRLAR